MSGPSPQTGGVWERTDPRMLVITIVGALRSAALPIAVLLLGFGRGGDSTWPAVLALAGAGLAVLSGITTWFATRYLFDGSRLQVRTGVLSRTVQTVQTDRVRSVELEASLLHRLLGLAKVTLGTGNDTERITLDSLGRAASARLRTELLRRGQALTDTTPTDQTPAGPTPGVGEPSQALDDAAGSTAVVERAPVPSFEQTRSREQVLAVFEPSWVRFALANRGGFAALGLIGGAWTVANQVGRGDALFLGLADWLGGFALVGVVVGGLVLLIVLGGVLSAASYARTWWGMRLVRDPGGMLHLSRGLTTTTSSTLEEARIRGVELTERLVLRVLRGARLRVLTTGVGTGGTSDVLPACPRDVATAVGRRVLSPDDDGADEGGRSAPGADPLTVPTRRHGPRVLRRFHVGVQLDTALLAGIAAAVIAWRDWSWWLLLGALPWAAISAVLAVVTYRMLGHALTADHLIVTDGTLRRRRVVLERRGIIGWTFEQSVLQRRLDLVTLTATTAAGPESVSIVDVPLPWALELAQAATPDVIAPFIDRGPAPTVPSRRGKSSSSRGSIHSDH